MFVLKLKEIRTTKDGRQWNVWLTVAGLKLAQLFILFNQTEIQFFRFVHSFIWITIRRQKPFHA